MRTVICSSFHTETLFRGCLGVTNIICKDQAQILRGHNIFQSVLWNKSKLLSALINNLSTWIDLRPLLYAASVKHTHTVELRQIRNNIPKRPKICRSLFIARFFYHLKKSFQLLWPSLNLIRDKRLPLKCPEKDRSQDILGRGRSLPLVTWRDISWSAKLFWK